MTIGKIYYLSTICGNLYWFLFLIKIPLIIIAGLATAYYVDTQCNSFGYDNSNVEELQSARKYMKWTITPLVFVIISSFFIPNKEDFLIITMTKNYTTEQVYAMTKEEMKSCIDYFLNQVKELKK